MYLVISHQSSVISHQSSVISHQSTVHKGIDRLAAIWHNRIVRDYHKLEVWDRARQLAVLVYRYTARFPSDERYGLTSQMRRAATSVPSNIAEGAGRPTRTDYARFLGFAASSLHELQCQTELCADLGFGNEGDALAIRRETAELRAMITALRAKVNPPPQTPTLTED